MLRRHLLLAFLKPRPLATQLAQVYGQTLTEVVYIQTTALLGRLRLNALPEVERLVQPFINGEKDSLANMSASHLSGHLLFAELHRLTGKPVYEQRVQAAASRAELAVYNEMSDGVFMGCPLLARAGQIEKATAQFDALQKLCLRSDGLWRHSPLCDAAWGRGNAFPALGLALALESNPNHKPLRTAYANLCAALAKHQTANGLWRQVIDHPTAYEEFSATAMIATAMRKGIRNGWLPKRSYQPLVDRAWQAISLRTTPTGELKDVCESTGKQKTLEAYLTRRAISGRDPRGGAMALYFATEK